jgi:hypothetical protein
MEHQMPTTTSTTSSQPAPTAPCRLHDLLTEAVFSVRETHASTDVRRVTLPGLLAALYDHPDLVLAGMRPHQEIAVLSFLVYLAAACGDPHNDESTYRQQLLALANGVVEAWCLYVSDPNKPAFLQSPGIPDKKTKSKAKAEPGTPLYSPSALDVLFTLDNFGPMKHHDRGKDPESWAFAIISQQGQGIPAASNGTTARGGHGRVSVSFVENFGFGYRWKRFVEMALQQRDQLLSRGGFKATGGAILLWLRDFVTGEETYSFKDLDPFFIDDSAKIRLFIQGGRLYARKFTFTAREGVDGKLQKKFRRVEVPSKRQAWDLFAPVRVPLDDKKEAGLYAAVIDDRKSTLFQSDLRWPFSYDRVVQLLFTGQRKKDALEVEYDKPFAFSGMRGDSPGFILLQGIGVVAGKAGTYGWNERVIPFDGFKTAALMDPNGSAFAYDHLLIAQRGQVILTEALAVMLKLKVDEKSRKLPLLAGYTTEYHNRIDKEFFTYLGARVDGAPFTAWIDYVLTTMRSIFADAKSLLPRGRAAQALVLAEEVLNQPFIKPRKTTNKEAA